VNKLYTESDLRTIFPHSASLSGTLMIKSITHMHCTTKLSLYVHHRVSTGESIRESAETTSTNCHLLAQCSSWQHFMTWE